MAPELWWYLSRASGLVAWGLASTAVVGGLGLASRAIRGRPTAAWQTDIHRFVGGLSVVFTLVHMAALVADSYVQFDLVDLLVPFAAAWNPLGVALGVVAFWLLVAVQISSMLRTRLSRATWKRIHYAGYGVWTLGTIHLFAVGTDAGAIAGATVVISVLATTFFVTYRLLTRRRRRTGPARAAG